MNNASKTGEVFKPAEKVPFQKGKIVNIDITSNDKVNL